MVSTPDWHFQGFRSSSLGGGGTISTYVLILCKFLLLYVYMLVYVLCQYLSSLLFFEEIIHNESFTFFPRGEVGKLKFLSNSQIGPYSLMPIATSPISDVASLTQPSPQQPVVL